MSLRNRNLILYIVIGISVITTISILGYRFSGSSSDSTSEQEQEIVEPVSEYMYGICIDSLNVNEGEVKSGSTFSTILSAHGVSAQKIDQLVKKSDGVFDLRGLRGGKKYNLLVDKDSLATPRFLVYEHSIKEYIVFALGDSVYVAKGEKPVTIERRRLQATITSSLWNAIVDNNVSYLLSEKLEDAYQWSVDFYGIQNGDNFNVIYDEEIIEGESVGIGQVYGAWFETGGKKIIAINYDYDGRRGFWDENGKSAKKAFLKAPLSYSRISSKFTASRMHPVLRIRRPHFGVDYAAPSGTPVRAIADGTITMRKYSGGGGNTIKIKHSRGYESGYLHLRGYAKGISVGKRVSQGDIIGYVGSTGLSTGPHLDFRIWKGGKPIDPLKLNQEPGVPLPSSEMTRFGKVRDLIIAELEGGEYVDPNAADTSAVDTLTLEQ